MNKILNEIGLPQDIINMIGQYNNGHDSVLYDYLVWQFNNSIHDRGMIRKTSQHIPLKWVEYINDDNPLFRYHLPYDNCYNCYAGVWLSWRFNSEIDQNIHMRSWIQPNELLFG